MGLVETGKVGKRGTIVIPAKLRRLFGMEEGDLVIVEEREEGVLIRRAIALPIEKYSPVRKAEFLLSNAVDAEDYAGAVKRVKNMGLNPKNIPHRKPVKS